MRLLSLFSGCGGLDLGFEQAGFEITHAIDKDKTVAETYKLNHKATEFISKDIRSFDFTPLKQMYFDGIIGGPPCQSWSVAGRGRGLDDPRGRLFFDYVRVIDQLKPDFFVAENVSGILADKYRNQVASILEAFGSAGYHVTINRVEASYFGVPQERDRVFFLGVRCGFAEPLSFSNPEYPRRRTMRDAIWDLYKHPRFDDLYYIDDFSPKFMSRNRVRSWDQPAYTVLASGRQAQLHPSAPPMIRIERDKFIFNPDYISMYRRVTVRESARLQTFPDSFEFKYKKLDDAYKMIGNAVPVLLAYELAQHIKDRLPWTTTE